MVDAGVLPPLLKCLQDQPGGTPLVAHTLTVLRNIAWIGTYTYHSIYANIV